MSKKLEIITFFRNHPEKLYSVKELCKEFNLTSSAMWKNIRQLWYKDWLIKDTTTIPAKYKFNDTLLALYPKTK